MKINRHPPWYHFWNPYSGFIGGLICAVIGGIIYLICKFGI